MSTQGSPLRCGFPVCVEPCDGNRESVQFMNRRAEHMKVCLRVLGVTSLGAVMLALAFASSGDAAQPGKDATVNTSTRATTVRTLHLPETPYAYANTDL